MKMIPWTKVLLLASTMTFGVACSDSDGGSDTPAPAPTTTGTTTGTGTGTGTGTDTTGTGTAVTGPGAGTATNTGDTGTGAPAALSCEDSWTAYVNARPVGFLVAYSIASQTTTSDGTVIPSANSSYEDLVLVSDLTHVESKHTVTVQGLAKPIVTNVDITKTKWLSTCAQGSSALAGLPTAPTDTSVEILEQGPQSVTVVAGTFASAHVKGKSVDTIGGATQFESWTLQDGSAILVKAITQSTSVVGGISTTSNMTIELTKLVRP